MVLPCRIGVLPGESDQPQPLRLSVTIHADLGAAMSSGRLEDTVDYGELSESVRGVVERGTWTLLEQLAGEILRELTRNPRVEAASVRLSKVRPPLPEEFGTVAVEMQRLREYFWS